MSRLSRKIGNWWVIAIAVLIWIVVCVAGYNVKSQTAFYFLAALVGLVMGGIQSMSRSTYSKLLPETQDTTSFFSFYDVTEKVAIVLGIFTFGYLEELTGSMRNSIIALGVFFVAAFLALLFAKSAFDKRMKEVNG